MGRGLDHFRQVSTQLVPPPAAKEDEAYAIWAAEERGGPDLFDDA